MNGLNTPLVLRRSLQTGLAWAAMSFSPLLCAWPFDGFDETGISRLEEVWLTLAGEINGTPPVPGARWPTRAVDLRLVKQPHLDIPPPDPALTAKILPLLGDHVDDYALAILDLTDPANPTYAEWRGDHKQNVGSVGKLIGAMGLFQALADTYPDDTSARTRVLRETELTADGFSQSDSHTVRIFDTQTRKLSRRPIQIGDRASLWEYLDWMLSVSSNSAAAMVMRDAMMLRALGPDYPLANDMVEEFFASRSSSDKTSLFKATFWQPVTRNGFDIESIRQGSFFTRGGKHQVNGGGNSYATVRSLMRSLLRMEQGRLVDEWSSRQLKRLLYLTERRIRYASSPALRDAAVYFKSGSLYSCKPEPDFKCGKYRGNVRNYMNSVAIIEQDLGSVRLHYAVTLISNVLRENSAVAHQTLGTRIHRLMTARHAPVEGAGAAD